MKTLLNFLTLTILLIFVAELTKYLLNFDTLLYNSLSEKLTSNQIRDFFKLQEKWQWITYVFMPIYILLKTLLITSSIYIGVSFFIKKEITFKSIWDIIISGEFIFLLVPFFKIVWFYFFQTKYNLEDFQLFYPFSALNIIGYHGLESWFIYPFQAINLFELAYIIYLAFQVGKITESNTDNGFKIVCYSYLPSLILWITVVMFFTLNNS